MRAEAAAKAAAKHSLLVRGVSESDRSLTPNVFDGSLTFKYRFKGAADKGSSVKNKQKNCLKGSGLFGGYTFWSGTNRKSCLERYLFPHS